MYTYWSIERSDNVCCFPLTCAKAAKGIYHPRLKRQSHTISGQGDVFIYFVILSDFHQYCTGSQEVQSGLKDAMILYLCNFSSLVRPVSTPGCSPWMSTCQFQDNLPLDALERAPSSPAHAFLERHTAQREKILEVQGTPL